jgi:hypothetical protein
MIINSTIELLCYALGYLRHLDRTKLNAHINTISKHLIDEHNFRLNISYPNPLKLQVNKELSHVPKGYLPGLTWNLDGLHGKVIYQA